MLKAVPLLLLLLLPHNAWAARNVLILVENDMDSRFSLRLQRSLAEYIPKAEANIFIHEIPMDYEQLQRRSGASIDELLISAINLRFQTRQMFDPVEFDEVIAEGTSSGKFLDNNPQLFPNAKRSFFHILWEPKTGQLIRSDLEPKKSFEMILGSFPQTEHVVFFHFVDPILGADKDPISIAFESAWQAHFRNQVSFDVIDLYGNEATVLAKAKQLPPNTAAIYLFFRDARPISPEFDDWVTEQHQIPVFGLFEDNVERFLGGAVIGADRLADVLVAHAEQRPLEPPLKRLTKLVYNHSAMQAWGITPEQLPEEAIVLGQPDTSVSRPVVMLIVLSTSGIIVVLLLILAMQQRYRLAAAGRHAQDIAAAAEAQNKLLARLRLAREHSAIGEWSWSKRDDSLELDAIAARLHGINAETATDSSITTIHDWRDMVAKRDLTAVDDFLHCVQAGLKATEITYRIVTPRGSRKTLRVVGAVAELDDDGSVLGVHGLVTDITDTTDTQQRLEAEVSRLMHHAGDGHFGSDVAQKSLALAGMGQVHWDLLNDEIRPSARASEILNIPLYPGDRVPNVNILLAQADPDDVARVIQKLDQAKAGKDETSFTFRVHRSGDGVTTVKAAISVERDSAQQPVKLTIILLAETPTI